MKSYNPTVCTCIIRLSHVTTNFMQLVLGNWANFQLHVSHATENQLHKTVAKCQISSSDLSHATWQLYLPYINFSWYNLLEVLMPLFHLQLDVVHFMWHSSPLKERWCPHHTLRFFFFADLVWNSFMASWACSMLDSFTQEAYIEWYPFHLTRYSRSRPLSCLNLSTASTSNSGSLWTKSGGGLEVCSRLGLEASRATGFKKKTSNVGWTLRFSGNSNL